MRTALLTAASAALVSAQQDCSTIPPSAFVPISLRNSRGVELSLLPYGGTAQRLLVPLPGAPPTAPPIDILLGFDAPVDYCAGGPTAQHPYFGALIGQVANRIPNCTFSLGGKRFTPPCNEQSSVTHLNDTLHGGTVGWDRRVWSPARAPTATEAELTLDSPAGFMGFPSSLRISAAHALLDPPAGAPAGALGAWELRWRVTNVGAEPTPVAPTMHAYFMLSGFKGEDTVLKHVLRMRNATRYEAVDAGLIPTGELVDVTKEQRWMDFTAAKALGADFPLPSGASGYDNAWIFEGAGGGKREFALQAELEAAASGLRMEVWTDAPSVQVLVACGVAFPAPRHPPSHMPLTRPPPPLSAPPARSYTGNFLEATGPTAVAKKKAQRFPGQGPTYAQHSAVTFEAQEYIGAANIPSFPSITLAPGGTYTQRTAYVLSRA